MWPSTTEKGYYFNLITMLIKMRAQTFVVYIGYKNNFVCANNVCAHMYTYSNPFFVVVDLFCKF